MEKGQASVEFLMTYGWALLIIIVVGIVAWQWGLFDISGNITPGYSGFWGVVPGDFSYKSNGDLTLSLRNGVGACVNVTYLNLTTGGNFYEYPGLNIEISAGDRSKWTDTGHLPGGSPGSRFEIYISIRYIDSRTLDTYTSSGIIWGSIES